MNSCSRTWKILLPIAALLILAAAGCSSSAKVEVPILTQSLPANSLDEPVELYWTPRSFEEWLQLPGNPEKAPDLDPVNIRDTHGLWENFEGLRKHSKVADLEASGQISVKHPREWLLLDLGTTARSLGADGVVINSLKVTSLVGQPDMRSNETLFATGQVIKVWVYAQAFRYE